MNVPFVGTANNRGYLNTKDYLLLNAFIEKSAHGSYVVKRPAWNLKKAMTLTNARGFTFCQAHSLFYAVFADALYSISADLLTATEISRKTPTSVTWSAPAAGTFTFIFAAAHGFIVGQQVKSSGISPAAYTNVFTVAAVSTTTIANDTFTVTGVGADPGASSGATKRVSPILTDTGKIYFEQAKNGTAQVVMLQVPKGTYSSQLFMIAAAGAVTKVTSANYPTTGIGAPVVIDGYVFTLAENTALSLHEIHNCVLETPLTYNALDYISAEMRPDAGVTLARHHNQLVCFKEYSIEFFYDAKNPTGSPLSRITQQTQAIGCASAASVVNIGNTIAFLSRTQNGGLGVHVIIGGQTQKVSTLFIDKILASVESIVFSGLVDAFYLSYEGHDFYVLSFEGVQGTNQGIFGIGVFGIAVFGLGTGLSTFKRTLVCDMSAQPPEWAEWSTLDAVTSQQSSFFGGYAVSGPHVSNMQDYTNSLIMSRATGDIYEMSPAPVGSTSPANYSDGGTVITVNIITENIKLGINKSISKLEVIGDRQTITSNLSISYSDDDYQTFSAPRTVSLQGRAFLNRLGMTRSGYRAFKYTYTAEAPLRLESFVIETD